MLISNGYIDKEEVNNLVEEIANGNPNATTELYTKMYLIIFHFLLKIEYDEDLVKEAISSTFCVIISKSASKLFYKNCFSWILSIAKNQLRNIKRAHNKIIISSEYVENTGSHYDYDKLTLKAIILTLPKQDQQLLYLNYFHGLQLEEIAKIMKVSLRTVKRRKAEILDVLKEKFINE